MSAFDPSRHYIIARDKETGEHVHVSLPDLVREVRTIEVASPSASFDDSDIRRQLIELRMKLDQLNVLTKQHEADLQQLMHALTHHTHETIRSAAA